MPGEVRESDWSSEVRSNRDSAAAIRKRAYDRVQRLTRLGLHREAQRLWESEIAASWVDQRDAA